MKNAVVLSIAFVVMVVSADCAADSGKKVVVVTSEWFDIFDQCMEGFRLECERETVMVNVKDMTVKDALEKVDRLYPDVVLAIDDQALEKISGLKDTPIVYVMAKKAKGMPQPNITGVEADVDPYRQLSVIRAIAPKIGKIGLMYSDDCARIVADLKKLAPEQGIELVAQKVETGIEARRFVDRVLAGDIKIDAFVMLSDLGIYNEWKTVRRVFRRIAVRKRIPVISFTEAYMRSGATFSISPDACYAGRQAGKMVERVLAGQDVGEISPEYTANVSVTVNPVVARKSGLELTPGNLPAYCDFNRGKPKWFGSDTYCLEPEENQP